MMKLQVRDRGLAPVSSRQGGMPMSEPNVQRDDGLVDDDADVLSDLDHLRLPYIVDHEPIEGIEEPGA